MSEYIATAQVLIQPDLKGFNAALKTKLNDAIKDFNTKTAKNLTPVKIPVAPKNLTKAQLNSARVAAQKTAATLKPVQLSTSLAGVKGTGSVTAAATKANAAITKTGTSARATGTNLALMNQQAGRSRTALLGLGTASARLDSALLGLRTAIGSTAVIGLGAGALAAIALGKAIRSLITITTAYERELNTFQAVTGASADEMERVAAAAKELGADITLPAVSAADAAVAMSELAKAGLSVQDAIDGARGVLQLATAANIGFAQAVEIAASAINAFGLSGKDAVKVADTLANAANAAQGSITDIGIAFQQANAVGALAGLTFQDTTVYLTQLAQAGLKGSDAGTSLRTALIRLINPSAKAAAIIKELGISIRDEAGNIRPDVFLQLSSAMRGMSKEQRDANLAIIGGQDALRALAILGKASTRDFLALRAELRKQGTAAEVAAARTKGLGGAYQALQSTLETIGITIGQRVSPGLTEMVNSLTATANALAQSEGVAAAFSAGMAGVATALTLVGTAASTVGPLLLGLVNVTSKVTFGFGSSLVGGILATVVAFKAYKVAVDSALVATVRFQAVLIGQTFLTAASTARAATGAITGFATGLRAVGALLATSINPVIVGVAALAAGLIYLKSRGDAATQTARDLAAATDDLAGAISRLEAARRGEQEAALSRSVAQVGLVRAKDEVAAARARVATTKGTGDYRESVIQLVTALQNLQFAQDAVSEADKRAKDSALETKAALQGAREERAKTVSSINAAIKQIDEEARAKAIAASRTPEGQTAIRVAAETEARKQLIATLRDQAKADFASTDAAIKDLGRRKDLLVDLAARIKEFPDTKTVKLLFDGLSVEQGIKKLLPLFAKFGFDSAAQFNKWLTANLLGGLKTKTTPEIEKWLKELEGVFATGGTNAGAAFGTALEDALAIAVARGVSLSGQLAIAQTNLTKAQAAFNAFDAKMRKQGGAKTPAQKDELARLAEERNKAANEVERLTGQIKSDAQAQQQKIEDAANARDKAAQALFELLTSTGKGIRALNKKLEDAGVTPTLTDDIKFTKILLATYRKIQKNLARRLKELGASASVIRELTRAISDLVNDTARDLKKLQQDQADAIKAANEAAQNALMAKFDAQIRFFEIKGDIQGQIKARTARLKAITAQLAKLKNAGKRYTAAWWDLKAQQAEEIAAIKELKGQTKEKNKEQAALMFAFLQAQQGFAANLLGNLIGGGMTGGLVGNTSPTAPAGQKGGLPSWLGQKDPGTMTEAINSGLVEQGQISAGMKLGVSRGQGTTQTELLRQILRTLDDIKRGSGFPGAKYQKARVSSSMDTGGGSGGAAVVA